MMKQRVVVRKMQVSDLEAVQVIDQMCFSDVWNQQTFEDLFRYRTNRYYVAELTGVICGFAGLSISMDTADIMKVGVSLQYRRQGIGRRLLEALLEEAVESNCREILLEVRESNEAARNLYRHAGFAEIAVRRRYYQAPMEDGIVMQRLLERKPEHPDEAGVTI